MTESLAEFGHVSIESSTHLKGGIIYFPKQLLKQSIEWSA